MTYVPASCCKDTKNTPNKSKCMGLFVLRSGMQPIYGPPVSPDNVNEQLYQEVGAMSRFCTPNLYLF